jgi:hypothetical protein
MSALPVGGFGIVGLGISSPSLTRTRPDLCAEHGHPGATYNPQQDKTWCLCGEVVRDGDHHEHVACCDGPLMERRDPESGEWS